MTKNKPYSEMTLDELTEARIQLDLQMTELRAKKKEIQQVLDRRLLLKKLSDIGIDPSAINLSNIGNIESAEDVGGLNG